MIELCTSRHQAHREGHSQGVSCNDSLSGSSVLIGIECSIVFGFLLILKRPSASQEWLKEHDATSKAFSKGFNMLLKTTTERTRYDLSTSTTPLETQQMALPIPLLLEFDVMLQICFAEDRARRMPIHEQTCLKSEDAECESIG